MIVCPERNRGIAIDGRVFAYDTERTRPSGDRQGMMALFDTVQQDCWY